MMTISEAYDAALSGWLEAGLTIEQAKERIDATEETEFRVEASYGAEDEFCFYSIMSGHRTIASTWGSDKQQEKHKLATLLAASPNIRKALQAIIDADFRCDTDEQFSAIDMAIAALAKAEDSAE